MESIYILVCSGLEWEDIVVYLSLEEAVNASKKYPKDRVAIFSKTESGYKPTYDYYKNGVLVIDS
jgi:hypothetical protein